MSKKKVRKAPPSFDKQIIRDEGVVQGINKLDPLLPVDILQAQSWQIPKALIEATTQTYRYIFWRLTGKSLEEYQRDVLGIAALKKMRSLAIVFGSASDIPSVQTALGSLRQNCLFPVFAEMKVHVISCHRNPNELREFAAHGHNGADVIIAAGSKAFALPGVLDAMLHSWGKSIPVIGVALGEVGSKDLEAARLSISELPNQPVVMDEEQKCVYEGSAGFMRALDRAARGEFPFLCRTAKPARLNIDLASIA